MPFRLYQKSQLRQLVEQVSGVQIIQGYILAMENAEIRIRQMGDEYFQTTKGAGDLSREEFEHPISRGLFNALWPTVEKRFFKKVRHTVVVDGKTFEVDLFDPEMLAPLVDQVVIIEAEFANEDEARTFVLPSWLEEAIDVTRYKNFKGKNIALAPKNLEQDIWTVLYQKN